MLVAAQLGACVAFNHPDSGGASSKAAFSFSYAKDEYFGVLDTTAMSLVPATGGDIGEFSVEPALPAGMSIDAGTGRISGTPAETADGVTYTVTASGASGSAHSESLKLTVLPGYEVDVTADGADDDAGSDDDCSSAAAGGCSLRAAIQTANGQSGRQLILLEAGSHVLTSAAPDVTSEIELAGAGRDSTVVRPSAPQPGFRFASIHTGGSLNVADMQLTEFGDTGTEGGVFLVSDSASLDVRRSKFVANHADDGGVLDLNDSATAVFRECHFEGNGMGNWGGVINAGGGTTLVENSYATANETNWGGFSHLHGGAVLTAVNSTFYANVNNSNGTFAAPDGTYHLTNITVVGNSSTAAGGGAGIYSFTNSGFFFVANSIFAFNLQPDLSENNCKANHGDYTVFTSLGGNIINGSGGACAGQFSGPGDRLSTDPLLEAAIPSDHGGSTPTFKLTTGSPAVDGAVDAECPDEDQRGIARPVDLIEGGARCDSGALELSTSS